MPEHIDTWIVIAGALFNSGILVATVRSHGKSIEKLQEAKEDHSNRIGVLEALREVTHHG